MKDDISFEVIFVAGVCLNFSLDCLLVELVCFDIDWANTFVGAYV